MIKDHKTTDEYKDIDNTKEKRKRSRIEFDCPPEIRNILKLFAFKYGLSMSKFLEKIILESAILHEQKLRDEGKSDMGEDMFNQMIRDHLVIITKGNKKLEKRKPITRFEIESLNKRLVEAFKNMVKNPVEFGIFHDLIMKYLDDIEETVDKKEKRNKDDNDPQNFFDTAW